MPYDRFHAAGDRDCGAQRKPATDPTQEDEEELLGGGGCALGLGSLSSRLEDPGRQHRYLEPMACWK